MDDLQLSRATNFLDFSDAYVLSAWSAVAPVAIIMFYAIWAMRLPIPNCLRRNLDFFRAPFRTFLTIPEAEAYSSEATYGGSPLDTPEPLTRKEQTKVPIWLTLTLSGLALIEAGAWIVLIAYTLTSYGAESSSVWPAWKSTMMALSWIYASAKSVISRKATPSYDLLALYFAHFLGGALLLCGALFPNGPQSGQREVIVYAVNLAIVTTLIIIAFSRPLTIPSDQIDVSEIGKTISPEDYTTLWGWVSFSWVYPLIRRGTVETLNEEDVWQLGVTMQARPVFLKFSEMKGTSLLRQLWASNSLDIAIGFFLTFVSVLFNYSGPYFLKRIIDAIDNPSPELYVQAYIFAIMLFFSQVLKSETDLQYLWFVRRAAVRIRSEVMASVYEKALKRRDYSGIVADKDKRDDASNKKGKKKQAKKHTGGKGKADSGEERAGADIGKIVSLMSSDGSRLASFMSSINLIYGAPFEIVIACTFLYQLLGWSAFTGFLVILLCWPLSNFLTRRAVRIQKGTLAARDKRMTIINELISAVKFVKFFAWEECWIQRGLDAREVEMKWLVKARTNSVMYQILWTSAPVLVSVVSFFSFVYRGSELTIGTAFTAIALFNMIRTPLNVIPSWIVQVLQARVSLQRIETFLNEDEVDAQVSTIKRVKLGAAAPSLDEFGFRNASFKWNVVEDLPRNPVTKSSAWRRIVDIFGRRGNTEASSSSNEQSHQSQAEVQNFELREISIVFPEGKLTLVTGPTASGKSALLLALLGEMTLLAGGEILMSKEPTRTDQYGLTYSISYAAQTPWLQHQSIKDNILFGNIFDEDRYYEVIKCCALLPDLETLEDGDETEIGARGVNLSGGQKARVALARAVYARTKYILLDDPLSAVDSHTARFLYEHLFNGPLMQHRTVILVTHHVGLFLPSAHYFVRMRNGRLDVKGTIEDLRRNGTLEQLEAEDGGSARAAGDGAADAQLPPEIESKPTTTIVSDKKDLKKKPRKFVTEETRAKGSVRWSIYRSYLKASSFRTWAILLLLISAIQMMGFAEKFWIKIWGEAYERSSTALSEWMFQQDSGVQNSLGAEYFPFIQHFSVGLNPLAAAATDRLPPAQDRPLFYVWIYALIGLITVCLTVASAVTQYFGALLASRRLFKQLLETVVHATMRWHDTTPIGRMLNRFSQDISTVDSSLAGSLQSWSSALAGFISSVVIVIVVFPPFFIPASIIGYFYYRLAIGYFNTCRDLRRIESTTRSPIFSGFGEMLDGIVTVRAFSAEPQFLDRLFRKINSTLSAHYFFWMVNRWLLLRFDTLGALAVLITALSALSVNGNDQNGRAGWAALSITSAMAFTNRIYWTCRFWTRLELDLNAVERIVEYLDLPQEPPAVIEGSRPPAHWPTTTGPNKDSLLIVQDLEVRYSPELPSILHGVSFTLRAEERVGILGRTGSGKSTLAMSLLRFVDPFGGKILIDGVDIASIGINDLRSRIIFIPQDATLFSGTLRDNLDPFEDYSESDCLDALRRVHLITDNEDAPQGSHNKLAEALGAGHTDQSAVDMEPMLSSTPEDRSTKTTSASNMSRSSGPARITLDTQVSAGGLNFSAGQRQLIAMARALLRRSALIILDEATSSIDFETDEKIQRTIREEFHGSLMLTIAHRLRTIIDYDRLIVLDAGGIAEFDTPFDLIQKEGGIFREMCLKSGSYDELFEISKENSSERSGFA